MNTGAMGDLAQGLALRNRGAALKREMQQLSAELTTGQTTQVRERLAGNYSFLSDVARKVEVLDSYKTSAAEATQFAGAMQLSLSNFADLSATLSADLMTAGLSDGSLQPETASTNARNVLDSMVSALNSTTAGRSLFAGNATNARALVDSDTLLTDLSTAIAGATTPADMIAAATLWFDDPAGFSASAYEGSAVALNGFGISPDETAQLDVRADDPGFRTALKDAALAALATDPAFGLTTPQQAKLFTQLGQDMLTDQSKIIELQSKIGFAEARIDTVAARSAAEITSLSIARNTLLEADPFETATKLEEVQFQLQSLYSVTVRSSQLSLLNYL